MNKNKFPDLLKRFNAWVLRVNNWFLHPSLLSLLISFLAPAFCCLLVFSVWICEPEYASQFLQMSSGSHLVPYETWCCILMGCIWTFYWCMVHWLLDLIKYIVSLFRKSSASADDK